MVGEQRDVLGVLAKRGHGERNDVEAIEEVEAEFFLGDGFLKVLVGGSNEADIQFDRTGAAEADEFALLKYAKELGLKGGRQFRNFVEEDGSAFRDLEEAFLLGDGAGEGATFMAEEFAFKERFGEGGAIERDEGARFARAVEVDSAGSKFLAGPAFAQNQDGGIGGRDAFDELINLAHARAAADHVVLKLHFGAEAQVFAAQAFELSGVFDSDGSEAGDGGK